MMPPGPNPLALRRCLPGRAYSTCVHAPSGVVAPPISPPIWRSESLLLRLPTKLRLQAHPFGSTLSPAAITLALLLTDEEFRGGSEVDILARHGEPAEYSPPMPRPPSGDRGWMG